MFRQAKQSRVYQDVVEQIQEAIVTGKLKTGDQLPAERDLKERFQVSRGTLREALRVLEQQGLIEIRTGVTGGSVVKGVGTEQVSASLGLLIRYKKVSLQNLAEFRIGLEGDIAALAARRADPQDIAGLKELLAAAADYLAKGPEFWDSFISTDEKIHLRLAELTRNPLFISVLESLSTNIHTYYESFLPKEEALMRENHQDMVQLIAAIEARDSEEARRIAREHVRRFSSYMERQNL